MGKAKIIIVEDESIVAMDIRCRLEALGYEVAGVFSSGEDLLANIDKAQPDLILMDIVLKGPLDGVDTAGIILEKKAIPVIYLSAYGDDATLDRAKMTEPYGYILKPFEGRELHTTIEMALYKAKMAACLRESEERYRMLVSHLPNVVFRAYRDGSIDFFDDRIETLTGYGRDDFSSRRVKWHDLIIPEDRESATRILKKAYRHSNSYVREYRIRRRDGGILWVQEGSRILFDSRGKFSYLSGAFLDITVQKKEEAALQATNECFLGFTSSPEENIATIVRTAGAVLEGDWSVFLKQQADRCYIVESWIDRIVKAGKEPEELFREVLEKAPSFPVAHRLESGIHGFRNFIASKVRVNGKDAGTLCVLYRSDKRILPYGLKILSILTKALGIEEERREAQLQIIQTSKMSGVGVLASGIAHEFNNLIAIMRAKAELALLYPENENIQEALSAVMVTTERAHRITSNLLKFSRRTKPQFEAADLAACMEEILALVERELDKQGIRLVRSFGALPRLRIDVGQVQQVFLNLVMNAKEAMPSGGALTVTIGREGDDAVVRIADTGSGIKQEYIDKVFEPFFTTKEGLGGDRPGTGLGLAVSLRIIRNHQGDILLSSGKDGSVFTVRLPLADSTAERKEGIHA